MKKQALSGKHFWSTLFDSEGRYLSQCFNRTAIYHVILNWKHTSHKIVLHRSTVNYDFKGDTYEYSKTVRQFQNWPLWRQHNELHVEICKIQAMALLQGVAISQNKLEKKRWNKSHLILTTKTGFSQQLMTRPEHSVWRLIPA